MKTKESMFAQMRSAARGLMRNGPGATTGAIQNALQGLQALRAASQAQVQPLRDINPPPQGEMPNTAGAAAGVAATQALKNLMPELQARLDAAGTAARAPFDLSAFEMPGLAPQRNAGRPDALPGQFLD